LKLEFVISNGEIQVIRSFQDYKKMLLTLVKLEMTSRIRKGGILISYS